jgi:RNA polymerase sigma-70 factor (ECF subfamily)
LEASLRDTPVAELVERSARRDQAAYGEVLRRCEKSLLAVAYSILHDGHLAGDVVQDAAWRAWRRLGELRDFERFVPWLVGIVRHLAFDAQRRRRRCERVQGRAAGRSGSRVSADPADEAVHNEETEKLRLALESLEESTRTAVILRYYDGWSSRQIGEALGLGPAAVDMRLARARAALRRFLTAVEPAPDEAKPACSEVGDD